MKELLMFFLSEHHKSERISLRICVHADARTQCRIQQAT